MLSKVKKILFWIVEKWLNIIVSGGSIIGTWKAFAIYLPSMNGAYIWLICWAVGLSTIILLPLRNGIRKKQKIYTENTILCCNLTKAQLSCVKHLTNNIASYEVHCTEAKFSMLPMERNQDGTIPMQELLKQNGRELDVTKQTFIVCVKFEQNIRAINSVKYTVEYEDITKISEYKTLYFDKDFLVFSFVVEPLSANCLKNINQQIKFTI